MSNTVEICGRVLGIKEYKGHRVVTFKDIDEVHQRPSGTARRNFSYNRKRYVEGADYFRISADEFRKLIGNMDLRQRNDVFLMAESGYHLLVKSFTDNLAWEVQKRLMDVYFIENSSEKPCKLLTSKNRIYNWKHNVATPLIEMCGKLKHCSKGTVACSLIYSIMTKEFGFNAECAKRAYSKKYNLPVCECPIIDIVSDNEQYRKWFISASQKIICGAANEIVKSAETKRDMCNSTLDEVLKISSDFEKDDTTMVNGFDILQKINCFKE